MNFLEQELKKMFGDGRIVANPRFVGSACYGSVTDDIRVKLEFVTRGTAGQYEAVKATLLKRNEGVIDSIKLHFTDLFGRKQVGNSNFREGIVPYIWTYDRGEKAEWYVYKPTQEDYGKITQAVDDYLDVFREPMESQRMGQKMG